MRIKKLELWHINIPLRNKFYPTWIPGYPQSHNRFTLMQLTTNNNLKGLAAGVCFANERHMLGDVIGPYILGLDPCDIDTAHRRIKSASFLGWSNFWMEAAFYDIKAQVEGVPLWKSIGGNLGPNNDGKIKVYWSTGEKCDVKQHVPMVRKAMEQGYDGVKMRVHANTLQEALQDVRNIRKEIGNEPKLMVDANQGWNVNIVKNVPDWDLERAKRFMEGREDCNIEWLEEPLDMYNYEDYAKLKEENKTKIKISGAELINGWDSVKMFFHFDGLDMYQPDNTFLGITDTLKVAAEAKKRNRIYTPHTWTNGFGLWTNMHTYALTDYSHPFEFPYELGSWEPQIRDAIFKQPILPKDGYLQLPSEPGLAAPIDWEKVQKYGTKFCEITEGDVAKKFIKDKGIWEALKIKFKKK